MTRSIVLWEGRNSLPTGLNRTRWKLLQIAFRRFFSIIPYLLGQIGLVGNNLRTAMAFTFKKFLPPLPTGSNRTCWKPFFAVSLAWQSWPYLLGQIGLVGNALWVTKYALVTMPYLLGQIGLVGNSPLITESNSTTTFPYLLGQIGLVGNASVLLSQLFRGVSLPTGSNRTCWKLLIHFWIILN